MTKDMLPGPYPRTPEERAAAAKKYNMRVEDYEPYPDEGMGYVKSASTVQQIKCQPSFSIWC